MGGETELSVPKSGSMKMLGIESGSTNSEIAPKEQRS
jgi:hypothetical protein